MADRRIHRASGIVLNVLSCSALLLVLVGLTQPPEPDEGALAHLFQLCIAALAPTLLVYLATVDRSKPRRSAWGLALPAAVTALAFALLYVLEHHR